MLVCTHCGELYNESDLKYVRESHGEVHCDYNCHCGGELIQAHQCSVCGEYFDNTELHGVCEECLEEYETVGMALEIGAENTTSVDGINGAVAHLLSIEQMNKILIKWVEENFVDQTKPIVAYLEYDKSYFSDYLAEKYGG